MFIKINIKKVLSRKKNHLEKADFTNETNFVNSYFLWGNKSVLVSFQVTWKDEKQQESDKETYLKKETIWLFIRYTIF